MNFVTRCKTLHWLVIVTLLLNSCASTPDYGYNPSTYGAQTQYDNDPNEVESEWRINWGAAGPYIALIGIIIATGFIVEAGRDTPDKFADN